MQREVCTIAHWTSFPLKQLQSNNYLTLRDAFYSYFYAVILIITILLPVSQPISLLVSLSARLSLPLSPTGSFVCLHLKYSKRKGVVLFDRSGLLAGMLCA